MAYCYECGEQVAENDVFCPYCGISLQPLAVAGLDEEDDSFSRTIVAQQPNAGAPPQIIAKESETANEFKPTLKSDDTPLKERLADDITAKGNDGFSNEIASGNLNLENDKFENYSDIPTPKVLEPLEPINDSLDGEAGDCKNKEAKPLNPDSYSSGEDNYQKPVFTSTEGEKLDNQPIDYSSDGEESDLVSQNESSLMSYEEAEIKEVLSAEEPEKSVGEDLSRTEESSLSPANKIDLGVFNIKEEPSAFADVEDVAPVSNSGTSEQPISIPEAELPQAESCPPSRFDSVSIMEKNESVSSAPFAVGRENSFPNESAAVVSSEEKTPEQNHSYTTPNIGGSDTDGKGKTKLKPLDEGTVLNGRYEIIRKIGGGGMGAVYLASDKNLGGVLRAVKEMVQSYIEDEQQEKAVNDFKRESLLLTSLDHQSIPTIYDYFFDEKEARFYLVMKYISGGDLAGRLRSAPESRIDEKSVTQWAIQIADVLDYLHNRQPPIVYRDLKPANIMVDGNSGRVMLIDFGIARWVNKEEKGVTAVGTMGYAPPELFSGNVEPRSDIYSLGSTMFHLLTGADPQSNPLLIFDFQKHPRPRQINPQLSDQMERILMRAVEYNAEKRFASAAEMRRTLEEHLDNLKAGRVTYGVKEAPVSIALSDQPVFCGFCGQKIVATDMFCAFCGAKQPLAQQGVHSHAEGYAPAPLTAQLLIIGTNELETPAFRLEKDDNLVGRRDPMSNIFPEVDLSKFDPQTKISRRHARIWREGSEFMVEDLGSSNGTYILPVVSETMRLQPHQPQLLTNGDKIRLGDTTLHFILG